MHFGYYRAGAGLHKNGSILMMPHDPATASLRALITPRGGDQP